MQKFSFTVDIVSDSAVDTDAVRGSLLAAIDGMGTFEAVHPVKVTELAEQGYKVWRARVTGVTAKAAGDAHNSKVEKEVEAVA